MSDWDFLESTKKISKWEIPGNRYIQVEVPSHVCWQSWQWLIAVLNNLLGMTRLAPLPSVPASPFLYPAGATHKILAGHCGVLVAGIAVKLKIGTTVYDQGDSAKRFLDYGVVE